MKYIVNIIRVLVGALFIFSGFVKAIDPLGIVRFAHAASRGDQRHDRLVGDVRDEVGLVQQRDARLEVGGRARHAHQRALRLWARLTNGPRPEVYHTNEGHAGFLSLERIRELVGAGLSFDEALETVRAATVFTTHTPVPAGIDRFPRELVEQYFGSAGALPGVPIDRILALGAEDYAGGDPTVFNMAVMGFRLAQRANGVSKLHGHVSRDMFHGLWPAFDEAEVPIGSITNGVHAPTWAAPQWLELGRELSGGDLPRRGRGGPAVGQAGGHPGYGRPAADRR